MNTKTRTKDAIVDFIEDEAFYAYKKDKSEIEKGTLAIYIFATLSLLSYILFFMMNNILIDWFNVVINILVLIIYYILAVYSSHEPFNAFISTICIVGLILITTLLLTSQLTIKGIILKIALIVFLSMKLKAAKNVQSYTKTKLNKP